MTLLMFVLQYLEGGETNRVTRPEFPVRPNKCPDHGWPNVHRVPTYRNKGAGRVIGRGEAGGGAGQGRGTGREVVRLLPRGAPRRTSPVVAARQ